MVTTLPKPERRYSANFSCSFPLSLMERVDNYADEVHLNRSEALRMLVERGFQKLDDLEEELGGDWDDE